MQLTENVRSAILVTSLQAKIVLVVLTTPILPMVMDHARHVRDVQLATLSQEFVYLVLLEPN